MGAQSESFKVRRESMAQKPSSWGGGGDRFGGRAKGWTAQRERDAKVRKTLEFDESDGLPVMPEEEDAPELHSFGRRTSINSVPQVSGAPSPHGGSPRSSIPGSSSGQGRGFLCSPSGGTPPEKSPHRALRPARSVVQAQNCFAEGLGLTRGVLRVASTFFVVLRNAEGQPCMLHRSDKVRVQIRGFETPPHSIAELTDSRVAVKWVPGVSGDFHTTVTINGDENTPSLMAALFPPPDWQRSFLPLSAGDENTPSQDGSTLPSFFCRDPNQREPVH